MNTKPYVFVATATASIIVCVVSFSGTKEEQLLPASSSLPVTVIYEPDETVLPPELVSVSDVFGYKGMADVLKEMDAPAQRFSFEPEVESTISGREGTVITFPANAFVDEDGNAPKGDVKIEMREYYDVKDILAAKLQTKSSDQMLESAGMIHVEATSKGKKLKLRDGVVCEMKFPKNDNDEDYKLFTGERDEEEVMDWTLTDNPERIYSERTQVMDGDFFSESSEFEGESNLNLDCFIQIVSSYRRDSYYINKMDFYKWKFRDISLDLNTYFLSNFNPTPEMLDDFCTNRISSEIQIRLNQDGTIRNAMVTKSSRLEYDQMFLDFVNQLPILDVSELLEKPDDNNAFVLRFSKASGTNKNAAVAAFRNKYKGKEEDEMAGVNSADLSYYIFNSSELGWINCDRFMIEDGEMVDINVTSAYVDSSYVSMVFEDMNSVLLGSNQGGKIVFNDVPAGKSVRIVSIRCVNGKPDMCTLETTTSSKPVKLDKYQPFSLAKLDEQFGSLVQ